MHQLEKCLQPAQDAQCSGRRDLCARIGDGQFVGFILVKFLHRLQTLVGMNLQSRRSARFRPKRNSGLPGKLVHEPLDCAIERGIMPSSNDNRERLIDRQLSRALLHACRHRHQIELWLGLSNDKRCQEK